MTNAPDCCSNPSFPDRGSFTTDFGEALAFKSLDHRWAAVGPSAQPLPLYTRLPGKMKQLGLHNGAPLPKP